MDKVKWDEPHAKYPLQSVELVVFLNEMATNMFTLANQLIFLSSYASLRYILTILVVRSQTPIILEHIFSTVWFWLLGGCVGGLNFLFYTQ